MNPRLDPGRKRRILRAKAPRQIWPSAWLIVKHFSSKYNASTDIFMDFNYPKVIRKLLKTCTYEDLVRLRLFKFAYFSYHMDTCQVDRVSPFKQDWLCMYLVVQCTCIYAVCVRVYVCPFEYQRIPSAKLFPLSTFYCKECLATPSSIFLLVVQYIHCFSVHLNSISAARCRLISKCLYLAFHPPRSMPTEIRAHCPRAKKGHPRPMLWVQP